MALLPPFTLDTVAAIGFGDDPSTRQWIGTGFVFGLRMNPEDDANPQYQLFLITNKHVLRGLKAIYIKFNSAEDTASKDYKVSLIATNGKTNWIGHPTAHIDVAAIFLNAGFLRAEKRKFAYFHSDHHTMTRSEMKDNQITEGDRIFVLGFPMGMVDAINQYVICRSGALARVRDFIESVSDEFLGDVLVFPGNSGGPVVICPSALSIKGTKKIEKANLIGIVKSYVPYRDVAVSEQTRRPRMIFEENSGLTAIESVDSILETVHLAYKRIKGRAATAKSRSKKSQGAEGDDARAEDDSNSRTRRPS